MSDNKKATQPMQTTVLKFIKRYHLISSQKTLLVAVSGGPDSVCLLHVLKNLQMELGINLHVAHLDHQLRGVSSAADASYVVALAKRLHLPYTVGKRDVRAYQKKKVVSLEEAAREVRYNFLAEVANTVSADCVAVGHTIDDHIETILLHLIRGAGTRGLRGLLPVNRWFSNEFTLTVVRPLLDISREETAAYCSQHRLKPRLDPTNLSLVPMRNRIRLELLPLLKRYNPLVIEALLRTARIADEDITFLENEAGKRKKRIVSKQAETIVLDKKSFSELAPSLQRYMLRLSIEEIIGTLKDVEARHIEEILKVLDKPSGKKINLPYGLIFMVDYDRYILGKNPSVLSPFPALEKEYPIKVPGETIIPGWRIWTGIRKINRLKSRTDKFYTQLDNEKVGKKLNVRPRQRGDRFQPLGMKGSKKINDFMLDARIPQDWRNNIPIVVNDKQVVWVVGYRIDERIKVTGNTEKVLSVKFERLSEAID